MTIVMAKSFLSIEVGNIDPFSWVTPSWHYHICEPKGANGPGLGKVAPVGIPCVRPQSDMMFTC